MKNKKNIINVLMRCILILLMMILLGYMIYYRNIYINNYFIINFSSLEKVKDIVISKNEEGILLIDEKKYRKQTYQKPIYNCFGKNECEIFTIDELALFKKLGIDRLSTTNGSIAIRTKKYKILTDDAYIYYFSGYYLGKQEGDILNGNEYERIVKIINDNWGVINSCYGCSGAWD